MILTFGFLHYNRFGYIIHKDIYLLLLIILLFYWVAISIYNNKYSLTLKSPFRIFVKSVLWSTTLSLFFVISTIALTDLKDVSRLFILEITIIPMFLELFIISIIRLLIPTDQSQLDEIQKSTNGQTSSIVSNKFIFVGAVLLIFI